LGGSLAKEKKLKASEIANILEASIDASQAMIDISGVASLEAAKSGELSFLSSMEFLKAAESSNASLILVKSKIENCKAIQLVVKDPYLAFAKISQLFWNVKHTFQGISSQAFIESGSVIDPLATVYAGAYISKGVRIGRGAVIYPFVFIGEDSQIGENTVIYANCVIERNVVIGSRAVVFGNTTIGADGFGFAPSSSRMEKIPQMGSVVIEDEVEIGPGCTIDRATFGETRIGLGTKLDSQVHIGHNVTLGRHNLICGKAGFAGSSKTEDFVVVGGNSNIGNLVTLHRGVRVGGGSTATKSLREPGDYAGFPAEPIKDWRKMTVLVRRLEATEKRLRALEETLQK
jgi:UDP-3-O-[3-hydroxymyristoyl] glucosamine N-acyltransferase